jgi:hypothetical protein
VNKKLRRLRFFSGLGHTKSAQAARLIARHENRASSGIPLGETKRNASSRTEQHGHGAQPRRVL